MKGFSKKTLALLLTLCMVLAMFPTMAFADGTTHTVGTAEDLTAALANAASGDTITLDANIITTSQMVIEKTLTLELNGKKLTVGTLNENKKPIIVQNAGDLTVMDSSEEQTGEIYSNTWWVIQVIYGGKLTVNSGTIKSNQEIDSAAILGNGSVGQGGTVININGGKIIGSPISYGCGIYHPQVGTLNITGGEISGGTALEVKGGTVNISGNNTVIKNTDVGHVANTNGSSTTGYAVALVENAGYATDGSAVAVNIGGGAFDGPVAQVIDSDRTGTETLTVNGGTFKDMSWLPYVADGATVKLGATITGDPINISGYHKTFSIDKTSANFSYPKIIGYYTAGTNYYTAYGYGYEGVTMSHIQSYVGKVYTYTYAPIDDSTIAAYVARRDGTATSAVYTCTSLDYALARVSGYSTYVHLKQDFTGTANTTKSTAFTLFPDGHAATGTIAYTGTSNYDVISTTNGDGNIDVSFKSIALTVENNGITKRYSTAELVDAIAYANGCTGETTLNAIVGFTVSAPIVLNENVALNIAATKTIYLKSALTVNGTLTNSGTLYFYHDGSLNVNTDTALGTTTIPTNYVQTSSVNGDTTTYGISADAAGEVSMKIGVGEFETYGTLAEALTSKSGTDVTVKLLKNVTAAAKQSITDCTLDLNGFTLSTASNSYLDVCDGDMVFTDGSDDKTGKVTGGSATEGLFNMSYRGNLTLEAGTFEDTAGLCGIAAFGRNSTASTNTTTIEIKSGAKLIGSGDGILIQKAATNASCAGVTVNVYGEINVADGAINVNGQVTDAATSLSVINVYDGAKLIGGVYGAGVAKWNFYGGTVTGVTEFKSGVVNVTDGTFNAANVAPVQTPNANGTSTNGGWAFAVVDNTAYGAVTATINGGVFNGPVALLDDDALAENNNDNLTIKGGVFSDLSGLPYVASGKTYTLGANYTLAAGKTATVLAGTTLLIPDGVILTNNGTIRNLGAVTKTGTFNNYGTVTGTAIEPNASIVEVTTQVETANTADVTTDEGKAVVAAAVETIADVPNEALTDTEVLANLEVLETKLTAANTNITASSTVAEDAPAAIVDVVVKNAALSVSADVATPTAAVVTVAAPVEAPTNEVVASDLAALGVQAAPEAVVIPLEIKLEVGGAETQPKAPLAIKLKVNMTEEQAGKLMIVHYKHDGGKELITPTVTTDGGVFLNFTATSLSTFVAIETANNNQFKVTFTPDKSIVSGGDDVIFTVKAERVAGSDPIGYLNLYFDAADDKFDFVSVDGTYGQRPDVSDPQVVHTDFEFFISSGEGVAVPAGGLELGTVTLKAKTGMADGTVLDEYVSLYTANNASGISTGSSDSPVEAGFTVYGDEITYRNLTVSFDFGKGEAPTDAYAKYNDASGILYRTDAYADEFTVPALAQDDAAGWRLIDTNWHVGSAAGAAGTPAQAYTTSAAYFAKLSAENQIVANLPEGVTITYTEGARLVGETYYAATDVDLKFTIAGYAPYTPTVKYGINADETIDPALAAGVYTILGEYLTGTVNIEATLALEITGTKVYTTGDGAAAAWQPYSAAYAAGKTLVLLKLNELDSGNYFLEGGPELYKLPAESYVIDAVDYNFAVLVPTATLAIDKTAAAMKTYLEGKLRIGNGTQATIDYDWNANGLAGARVADVQAVYDFVSRSDITWGPTDNLLLLADVLTYAAESYTARNVARDGQLTSADVDAFLYAYAFFPKPAIT